MRKVVESHKYAMTVAICIMFTLFIVKVGFELIEEKGIQKTEYTGERFKNE